MKKIIIILLGAFLLTSCLKDEMPFQYTIYGRITGFDGTTVAGAEVSLTPKDLPSIFTDSDGYYEFSGLTKYKTTYTIRAEKKESIYKWNSRTVPLSDSAKYNVSFVLPKQE